MNLQKLQCQRNGIKKIIERFIEKLAEASEEDDMIEFDATLETVQSKVDILQSLNEKILAQTDVDATEDEMVESEEYTLNLEIRLRKFKRYIAERSSHKDKETQEIDIQPRDTHRIDENSSNHSEQPPSLPPSFPCMSTSNASQFSRLPKLTLPKFDGDLLQWQSFWDSFESSVHSNMNLSDVQKFGYLKAQLEGTAAMTVEGFALTNANYKRAVELLCERYGQQNKIVHATMQALLNLPAPSSTISSLRQFYDKMETYIRGLESLGQSRDMYGSLLVPIVIDKLPIDLRKNLARVNEYNDWIIQDLRRAINKEINILETGSSNH
ncbi:uncharacterized protein LOC123558696 [Mercenaria mercenaria]|uniref:uncharacterized protein LOC123558696 n=1 Tax=Mercenaria mercenaria TaxID=6596 RepID=UPI00234F7167|nr:uncharacterized protein LOC123558696 [Mercenaria mercenaria]